MVPAKRSTDSEEFPSNAGDERQKLGGHEEWIESIFAVIV